MRFYSSMNALRMSSAGFARTKVQRNNLRNNINSQLIFNSAAYRAFASKVVPVPTMGDSISEGVIEEFIKGKCFSNLYDLPFIYRTGRFRSGR